MKTKIYLACVRPLQDDEVFGRLYAEASKERRDKIDRYRFQKDKLLSLGADALLRHALREAGYDKDPTGQLPVIAYGQHGKPWFPALPDFHFNWSHSGEYVMLAVSDAEVGCDIEQIRPVRLKIPMHVFDFREYERYAACAEEERDVLFFRYWVLKESFMKATGRGLALSPSSFRIELDPPIRVIEDGAQQDYGFLEGSSIPGYRYAACRAGGLEEAPTEFVDLGALAKIREGNLP